MDELVKSLKALVGDDNVLIDEPMNAHTTFGIGGPARCMVVPHEINEVADVVRACRDAGVLRDDGVGRLRCRDAGVELRVIGRGSDLLVADEGLDCVVMRIAENLSDILVTKNRIFAKAGATNEEVARAALEAGLAGYEFACGIPGTVGGAAIMNAGAYDGEFMDVCEQVICVTPEGEVVPVPRGESQWGYRHSMMDDRGYVVVSVMLALKEGDADAIRARMDDLQRRRADKQPLDMPSAGSTFKRPKGYFAGKLIQDAGLKGYAHGGAQVSKKHSGFVVNAGGATASDVRALIGEVQDAVEADSGVRLEPEVRMWGFEGDSVARG